MAIAAVAHGSENTTVRIGESASIMRQSATVPWLHWLMVLSSSRRRRGEIRDLAVDLREVLASNCIHGFA